MQLLIAEAAVEASININVETLEIKANKRLANIELIRIKVFCTNDQLSVI